MLDLNDLSKGLAPAISSAIGSAMAEAAGVCLESQGHRQGARLHVMGSLYSTHALVWPNIDMQARLSWADLHQATEWGATALAVLLLVRETGYAVIKRAAKGTGIDYWLGPEDQGPPFQDAARLEVSGILSAEGNPSQVQRAVDRRVKEKLKQTRRSAGSLPAYVVVIEFGSPLGEVRKT